MSDSSYGVTKEMTEFDAWQQMALWGLNVNIRPLKPWLFGPSPDAWTLDDREMIVDGRTCVVLTRNEAFSPSESWRTIVVLDPEREFVPLRWDLEVDGQLRDRCTMSYDEATDPPWIPTEWTATLFLNDTVVERTRAELESVTLNPEIRDDMFTIGYPSGTEVTEINDGKEAKKVVDAAGNWVPKRLAEAEQTAARWWPWLLVAAGCAALAVALLLWWRRARMAS